MLNISIIHLIIYYILYIIYHMNMYEIHVFE